MAVTRRAYIFGAFLSSVLSVLLVLISVSSDSWVVSLATAEGQVSHSSIQYGLFSGVLVLRTLATPMSNTLYMTCVTSVSACALSCKTEDEARRIEVEALANSYRPTAACVPVTEVDTTNLLSVPAVIPYAFYVCLLVIMFLHLTSAVISAALAITNATMNPTEPIFGLPGCLASNVCTAGLGAATMLVFGVYWAASSLHRHLALTYVASGQLEPSPGLGYSYWVLLFSVVCNLANVGLIMLRAFLLERDPPPPTIKLENHSDGTIFLY